jgi:hypothetical protein
MKQKGLLTIIVTDETLTTPLRCFSGNVSNYKEINDTIRETTNNGEAYYKAWLETGNKNELVDSNPETV